MNGSHASRVLALSTHRMYGLYLLYLLCLLGRSQAHGGVGEGWGHDPPCPSDEKGFILCRGGAVPCNRGGFVLGGVPDCFGYWLYLPYWVRLL